MSVNVYFEVVRDDKQAGEFAKVWKICKKHNIEVPEEIIEFFGGTDPEVAGKAMAVIDLPEDNIHKFNTDTMEYYDIDVSILPSNTKFIRVVVSY